MSPSTDTTMSPSPTTRLPGADTARARRIVTDGPPAPRRPEAPGDPVGTELTWRPLTPEDVPAWTRMIAETESADRPGERHDEGALAAEFSASWADPENDSRVGIDAEGVVRAFGWAQMRPGDETVARVHLWGAVHPHWRDRGVGAALLTWLEGRGRQLIAAHGGGLPARLSTDIDERNTEGVDLARRMGFRPVRTFHDLRLDLLKDLPEVTVPEGIRLVTYDDGLEDRLLEVHNETFADHWGCEPRSPEDWRRIAVKNGDFRPEWSFVALDGEQIAGYTLSFAHETQWAGQGWNEGWTGWLGVPRSHRGKGLAPTLLTTALQAFKDAELPFAGLEVDADNPSGAHRLYASMGYEPVRTRITMALEY